MSNSKNAKQTTKTHKNNPLKAKDNSFYYDESQDKVIVDNILKEFKRRQEERKPYELAWELNMNFMLGNQYSCINSLEFLLFLLTN